MNTPICDFVQQYAQRDVLRLHMPGHKGSSILGMESLDITEIAGADSLFEAEGIIRQSEENASRLFGARTFYSTEGSSLSIRAMLYLTLLYAKQRGNRPLIAAGRNAHKTFLSAASMLDFDIHWLYGKSDTYLSCDITAQQIEIMLETHRPCAVYLTCPDYLGNMVDLRNIAEVCHQHDVLLLVDNAHGAYLKFLPESKHPMDLGADLCCDSAHKTLPVLTGGAYLHISPTAPNFFANHARKALSMFASTSPSYLILQSLDAANRILSEDFREQLSGFTATLARAKERLLQNGYHFIGREPLKLTIDAKRYGYTGQKLSHLLQNERLICEFADPDYVVLMLSPKNGVDGVQRMEDVLLSIPIKAEITTTPPIITSTLAAMSVRDAALSPSQTISIHHSNGKILACPSVGCPPAVPIKVCGELIDESAIEAFQYYGISTCEVVCDELKK